MGFRPDNEDFPYDSFSSSVEFIWNTGILQTPVAGVNSGNGVGGQGGSTSRVPSVICAAAAPCGQMMMTFIAERKAKLPILPDPDPLFEGAWLASARIILEAPTLAEDNETRTFRVRGIYTYLVKQPVWMKDSPGFYFPLMAYDDGANESDNLGNSVQFGAENFSRDLWGAPANKLG